MSHSKPAAPVDGHDHEFLVVLAFVDRGEDQARSLYYVATATVAEDVVRDIETNAKEPTWLASKLDLEPHEVIDKTHAAFDSGLDHAWIIPMDLRSHAVAMPIFLKDLPGNAPVGAVDVPVKIS